jgi:hypothetical protein
MHETSSTHPSSVGCYRTTAQMTVGHDSPFFVLALGLQHPGVALLSWNVHTVNSMEPQASSRITNIELMLEKIITFHNMINFLLFVVGIFTHWLLMSHSQLVGQGTKYKIIREKHGGDKAILIIDFTMMMMQWATKMQHHCC